ncbi:MAG TPA: ABC transporter substrate-binding protein [Xanthobacteraceae bacterium]|nr:ABC transporter substrate-binding protein [Xanthobacteraceae bacterium]
MRRREFITLVASAALWPSAGRAVADRPPRRLGFLSTNTSAAGKSLLKCLMSGLRDRGWVDGTTLALDLRWGGEPGDYAAAAAELVRLEPDVIVTTGTPATLAVQRATSRIPVVFVAVSDPVASKMVASIARPGGNITGVSNFLPATTAKLVDYLRTAASEVRRVAVLYDTANPGKLLDFFELQNAGATARIEIVSAGVRASSDLDQAFAMILQSHCNGLITLQDGVTLGSRARIVAFAAANRLPAIYQIREFADAGGLMSYGLNYCQHYRSAAPYIDRILKGAKPVDLPVELPTTFELVINLKTAKALGLEIPAILAAIADEIIE